MLFAGLTSASLIKTVTWAVQRELIRAFGQSAFIFILRSKVFFVSVGFDGVVTFIALGVAVS